MGLVSKRHKQLTGEENESEDKSDPEIETEEEDMEDEMEDGDDQEGNDVMHDDGQKDAEMEELEKEYMNLRQQEQDLLKNLKRHKDEDFLKGQAVKNQMVLWDKALEIRISLQNAFSKSNKLPQGPLRSSYCDSDKSVNQAYAELITSSEQTLDSLLRLQEALLGNNPSIAQTTDGNIKGSSKGTEASEKANAEDDKEWSRVYLLHSRIAPFRDSSINKWQRKTQVTTGAAAFKGKLHAFNQNISEQVAAYMRDPNRMIKRMQLRRSAVGIFGTGPDTAGNKEEDANVDGDPELLDDSEFYQQLIKEFIETFDPTSSEASLHGEKKPQTKKRKIVDRRASKSRKIRYHVHEKIVNFMAPERMNLPPMAPKLFENLFGLKNK